MNKLSPPVLKLDKVNFRYSSQKKDCLNDISFSLNQGEYLVIIGRNGSGKSSLGKIIAGLFADFTGKIELFGQELNEKNHSTLIPKIGLVFQNPESQFIGSTVENDLVFGLETLRFSPNEMPNKILETINQVNIKNILYQQPINLSGGQKQKVAFGSTLISGPELIIFDEPTSLLDQKGKQEIFRMIDKIHQDRTKTLIEITHDMERIEKADKIMILEQGKIKFFGSIKEIKNQELGLIENTAGLKLPFLHKLTLSLRKKGFPVDLFLKKEEMAQRLWQLKKSKFKT